MSWKSEAIHLADTRIINYSGNTLCSNYRAPLERCTDLRQAARLYKSCISWALQERYPTKEELLKMATKEELAENGIYIDTHFDGEIVNDFLCCVFIGCTGIIKTGFNKDKKIIPMLYFSENTDLRVVLSGEDILGKIPVELYYGSSIESDSIDKFSIKNFNEKTAKDNTGFGVEATLEPDLSNPLLADL